MHVRSSRDLCKGDTQTVKREDRVLHPLGGLFFKTDGLNPGTHRERPVQRNKSGALEPARVGAIDHHLAHDMHLRNRRHTHHACKGQHKIQCLGVHRRRRFFIVLCKTGGVIRIVREWPHHHHLFPGRPVHLTHLGDRRPEIAVELTIVLGDIPQNGGAVAE